MDSYTLSWEGVAKTVKGKKILHESSGVVQNGELCGILGPSGAGKSTIMDILSCRQKPSEGVVKLNGCPLERRQYRHVCAYVAQEDTLQGDQTVFDNVFYTALLRLPASTGRGAIREKCDKVIAEMGLTHVRDSRVGTPVIRGISGDPAVLIMDEPTSGLDAASSRQLVQLLKNVALKHGTAVIATLHQPAATVFDQFDSLLLLSKGRTIYFGPMALAREHFAATGAPVPHYTNAATHYVKTVNVDYDGATPQDGIQVGWQTAPQAVTPVKAREERDCKELPSKLSGSSKLEVDEPESPLAALHDKAEPAPKPPVFGDAVGLAKLDKLAAFYRASATCQSVRERIAAVRQDRVKAHYANNFLFQTLVLTERAFYDAVRNPIAYYIRWVMYFAFGLLMGLIFFGVGEDTRDLQNRMVIIFYMEGFVVFMSVASTPAVIDGRGLFLKERSSGSYGSMPHLISTTLVQIPFLFIGSLLACAASFPLMGIGPFISQVYILALSMFAMEGLLHIVAFMTPIFVVALANAAFLNAFLMSVAGLFRPPVDLPEYIRWAHDVGYQSWAYRAMVQADIGDRVFGEGDEALVGQEELEALGLAVEVRRAVAYLVAIAAAYRVVLYVIMVTSRR